MSDDRSVGRVEFRRREGFWEPLTHHLFTIHHRHRRGGLRRASQCFPGRVTQTTSVTGWPGFRRGGGPTKTLASTGVLSFGGFGESGATRLPVRWSENWSAPEPGPVRTARVRASTGPATRVEALVP